MKIIFSETGEKMENFHIKYMTLGKNWIYYDLLKIKDYKNPEIKISDKIIKLTNLLIA